MFPFLSTFSTLILTALTSTGYSWYRIPYGSFDSLLTSVSWSTGIFSRAPEGNSSWNTSRCFQRCFLLVFFEIYHSFFFSGYWFLYSKLLAIAWNTCASLLFFFWSFRSFLTLILVTLTFLGDNSLFDLCPVRRVILCSLFSWYQYYDKYYTEFRVIRHNGG